MRVPLRTAAKLVPKAKDSGLLRIELSDREAAVRLRRSATARRMILRVDPAGCIVLTLPTGTGIGEARRFLERQQSWLFGQFARLPARVPFAPGAIVPYLGAPHRLVHADAVRPPVRRLDGSIMVAGAPEHFERRVADWLRREARRALADRAHVHARAVERRILRVSVRDTTSRWGSCSPSGALSFSWRLILAPPAVLDYVAAHEAVHLVEPNHGPGFWALLRTLNPGCESARSWLRTNGAGLHRYGGTAPPSLCGL